MSDAEIETLINAANALSDLINDSESVKVNNILGLKFTDIIDVITQYKPVEWMMDRVTCPEY